MRSTYLKRGRSLLRQVRPIQLAWLKLASLGVLSLALMAACGDDDQNTPNDDDSSASSSSSNNSSSSSGAGGGSVLVGDMSDDFDGDGPLVDYTTNNPNALPDVARAGGRYRANLVDNTGDITLHFNDSQGRLDAKLIAFPFEVVVRNIGIGTQQDSQTPASAQGNPYIFAGVQVHVPDLESRNSSHVVVGHRGETHFTIEGKNTLNGNSSVNDAGANIVPDGRADIRIVGNADRTLTIYWQTPNPEPGALADNWTLYNGDGTLPGEAPAYGDTVYVGLITYAFGFGGIPFVGTADSIEGGGS